MKNSLAFIVLLTCATMGFAQGKLAFINNADQLIYFTSDYSWLAPADANKTVGGLPLAGQTLYSGAGGTIASLSGAPTLIAGLFGGTTSDALTLQTTTTFGDVNFAGLLNVQNVTFADLPAGVPAFFRIDIFDSRATSAADSWAMHEYAGTSGLFQATPQAAAYSPIWQTTSPVNSTLPSGTFVPNDYVGFPGYFGLIRVTGVPEPGTLTLAALGSAALMILHRRK